MHTKEWCYLCIIEAWQNWKKSLSSHPEFSACSSTLCLFVMIVIGTASDITSSTNFNNKKTRVREYLKHMMLQIVLREIVVNFLTFNYLRNLRMRYCFVLFSEGKIVFHF